MSKVLNSSEETYVTSDLYSELFRAPVVDITEGNWPVVLRIMEIQPTVENLPEPCLPYLFNKSHEILTIARQQRLPIRFVGYAPVFSGVHVYHGKDCDWAMVNLSQDPMYYSNGEKLVVPKTVANDIKKAVKYGVDFDALFIAHEIPIGSVQSNGTIPLELIAPPIPPGVEWRVKKLSESAQRFWTGIAAAISELGKTIQFIVTPLTMPLTIVDPVLFGVHFDKSWQFRGEPVGMWYYLTHWYWPRR